MAPFKVLHCWYIKLSENTQWVLWYTKIMDKCAIYYLSCLQKHQLCLPGNLEASVLLLCILAASYAFSIDLELLIRTIFEVYDINRHKACNLAVVKRFNLLNPTDQQVVRSSQTHAVQPNMVQTHKSYFNFVEITTFYIKSLACRAKKHNLFMLWGSRQC